MKDNGKQRSFMDRPLFQYFLAPLVVALISIFVTRYLTQRDAVQKLSDGTNGVVSEGDTIEDAASKINDLQEQLQEKQQQIDTLTKQLNDDTELKNLNAQIEAIQQEKDKLQEDMDNLQKEKDKLQEEYNELEQKKYDEYIHDRQSNTLISLRSIEVLKNDKVNTENAGDMDVNGTSFAYYLDTGYDNASIEYRLDNNYSEFKGSVYISKSAYQAYDNDASAIVKASISIEVKYADSDTYQTLDSKSGLLADSKPVEIGGSVIGATRLRVVISGGAGPWGSIIRLGDPALYRALP